jgi:hypothetical protein
MENPHAKNMKTDGKIVALKPDQIETLLAAQMAARQKQKITQENGVLNDKP